MSIFTHKIIFCYTLHLEASLPVSDKTPKNKTVMLVICHDENLLKLFTIFSFAHLGDGENSWITDNCHRPLPLLPL